MIKIIKNSPLGALPEQVSNNVIIDAHNDARVLWGWMLVLVHAVSTVNPLRLARCCPASSEIVAAHTVLPS
jgi:hypothetical protein